MAVQAPTFKFERIFPQSIYARMAAQSLQHCRLSSLKVQFVQTTRSLFRVCFDFEWHTPNSK